MQRPKFGIFRALKDKFCGWNCCGDSDEDNSPQIQETQPSGIAADKKDDQVLDEALDGILDRQFDMKYILQLMQDMELIKRVVFKERH